MTMKSMKWRSFDTYRRFNPSLHLNRDGYDQDIHQGEAKMVCSILVKLPQMDGWIDGWMDGWRY